MNDSREIIMKIPDVEFETTDQSKVIGNFFLLFSNDFYSFEWKSNSVDHPSIISVSFQQISEIIRRDISFNEILLRIILTDSSRLPRLIFHSYPHIHIQHLVEYLEKEKVLAIPKDRPNSYKIIHLSSKTNADIFGYIPLSSMTALQVLSIAEHTEILKKLDFQPLKVDEKPVTLEEFDNGNIDDVKKQIFLRGICPKDRPYIWPILFHAIPHTSDKSVVDEYLSNKLHEYLLIKKRSSLFTEFQSKCSSALQDIQRIIYYDVKRNDRNLDAYKGNDNPNLDLLKTVLTTYAIFNRDSGYCQGMADLMSPLVILFIKGWSDDKQKVILYDDSEKTVEEAESFIFWNFVGMMNLTSYDRFFVRLDQQQHFVLERSAAIATSVHQPLKNLLDKKELSGLSFLFRPILLLFKREFKSEEVPRLWDSVFTAEAPYCFPRFIAAAILIIIYPKLLLHTDGTLGEVMTVLDGSMERTEVKSVLQIAINLIDKVAPPYEKHNFIYEQLPDIKKLRNYTPKYMKFIH